MEYKLTEYSVEDLKNKIKDKPFSHFVVDDFLDKNLFDKLDDDFRSFYDSKGPNLQGLRNMAEQNSNHKLLENNMPIIVWGKQLSEASNGQIDSSFKFSGGNVHYNNRTYGHTIELGGGTDSHTKFESLKNHSSYWDSFLNTIYSKDFFEYLITIFEDTYEFNKRVGKRSIKRNIADDVDWDENVFNCFVGSKISSYTDNYGWVIHRDTPDKVLSFLLYMDNHDWGEVKDIGINGTQFWKIGDKDTDFDSNEEYSYNNNSIDFQLRDGRFKRSSLLKDIQKKRIEMYSSIEFKPNRLIGFIPSDNSFHSVLPVSLPSDIKRNCFQINIWECNSKHEWKYDE